MIKAMFPEAGQGEGGCGKGGGDGGNEGGGDGGGRWDLTIKFFGRIVKNDKRKHGDHEESK